MAASAVSPLVAAGAAVASLAAVSLAGVVIVVGSAGRHDEDGGQGHRHRRPWRRRPGRRVLFIAVAAPCSGSCVGESSFGRRGSRRRRAAREAAVDRVGAGDEQPSRTTADRTALGPQVDDAHDVTSAERQHVRRRGEPAAGRPAPRRGGCCRSAQAPGGRARVSSRGWPCCAVDGELGPVGGLRQPRSRRRLPPGLKPNGGRVPDHGSGTRQPSRPGSTPPDWKCIGSWIRSTGRSSTSGRPSSSPWYR